MLSSVTGMSGWDVSTVESESESEQAREARLRRSRVRASMLDRLGALAQSRVLVSRGPSRASRVHRGQYRDRSLDHFLLALLLSSES